MFTLMILMIRSFSLQTIELPGGTSFCGFFSFMLYYMCFSFAWDFSAKISIGIISFKELENSLPQFSLDTGLVFVCWQAHCMTFPRQHEKINVTHNKISFFEEILKYFILNYKSKFNQMILINGPYRRQ